MVGAVLVDPDGALLGEGCHEFNGGPHAEVNAISHAERHHGSEALKRATLYINLEPCNHQGRTPPCVDLILQKCIPRVVAGTCDPNPKAAGGIDRLRENGVAVTVNVLGSQCRRLNEAFFHQLGTGTPLVTLKVAQTLDSHVAASDGTSRWITGIEARRRVHKWRAQSSGVLVGAGTARRDNPSLTVRHVSGKNPQRFVLDRAGALPPGLRLFTDTNAHTTTAVVGKGVNPPYAETFSTIGGRVLQVEERNGHLNLAALLARLGTQDRLQSLFVEAGPGLATALLRADLVDRLCIFTAPLVLGSGAPCVMDLGLTTLAGAMTFVEHRWEPVGQDCLFIGFRRAV